MSVLMLVVERDRLRLENKRLKAHIKRLEEAGDAMERWCSDAVSADNWRKAKEAKPCRYCLRSNCECSDSDIMQDIGDK